MSSFGRWWAQLVGAAARVLARHPSPFARQSHDGIELLVTEYRPQAEVDAFFARTKEALSAAARLAPGSYARLRADVARIILWPRPAPSPYHRFQQAVLVPVDIALEAEALPYAGWLLYVSGLSRARQTALDRAAELLDALLPAERRRVETLISAADRA